MIAALLAGVALGQAVQHAFVYRADENLQRVNLAGTFNNWNKDAWPMKADSDGRTWRFSTSLQPGKHLYKFVLNGDRWITDPKAAKNEDDGGGNVNSVLYILPSGYERPAKVGDGHLTTSTLVHLQEPPYLNYDQGLLEVQFKCRPNDAQRVELWLNGKLHKMAFVGADEFRAAYSAKVAWDRTRNLDYMFALWDKKAGLNYGANGLDKEGGVVPFRLDAKVYKPIVVPRWVEKTVQYQIFPDRFENGDPSNDPKNAFAWEAAPTYYSFHGGDFAGVQKRLGYLKSLGIGSIYFNPIFEGPSNHRYETVDYKKVDHRLGTNEEFVRLTQDLKAAGIKTVLDGVFNHVATDFGPFKDVIENGEDSKYKDWFYIKSYPVLVQDNPTYEAWFGFPSMPKVNLANPEAAKHQLDVPVYWHQKAAVAGWRLDVANEVIMDYWRQFRKVAKGLSPELWICGEHWGDGTPWLKGDQWDSIMNYPLREAILGFVANGTTSASACLQKMMSNYRMYAPQVSRNTMNLLSSHDTPRFLTLCKGDGKLARLGAVLQFGWPGMPLIYYGEELGMEGGCDPENRRGMEWSRATPNNPYLTHYRKLVAARNGSRALQSGAPVPLVADDAKRSLAFARVLKEDAAVVAANRSDSPVQLTLDLKGRASLSSSLLRQGFVDALTGARFRVSSKGTLSLRLEPKSGALLVSNPPSSFQGGGAGGGGPLPKTRQAFRLTRAPRPHSYPTGSEAK